MKILCYSPYNKWYLHGMWEITILQSLRLRGAEVKFVLCDGLYLECDVHWVATNPRTPNACEVCKQETSLLAEKMGMPYEWLGQYLTEAERQEAYRWAQALSEEQLLTAQYGEWKIGEWVRSSLYSHFRISQLDLNHPAIATVYRRYIASGLIAAFALHRLLEQYQPDLVFLFNGRFASLRVALELARARGIRVLVHERGWLNESIRLTENTLTHDPQQYRMSWAQWQDIPLTMAELERLQQYLTDRRMGRRANQDAFVPPPTQSPEELRQSLGIPEGKVIWTLFTSSDDEVVDLEFFPSPFRTQFEWIAETIAFVQRHPELFLIIRVHPNVKSRRSVGANLQTYGWFQQLRSQLPPNVRVVMPEEEINSYLLGDLANVILVYGSTMGLEMAAQGKYVLTAACPWYDGLEVVYRVYSRESYAEQLEGLLRLPVGAKSEVIARQACRYAYTAFFRHSILFPLVAMPTASTGRLRYTSLDALAPGKDAALDRIAAIVFQNQPVFETPQPEDLQRSGEEERQWHSQQPYAAPHGDPAKPVEISVVIPCYNHRPYLRQSVESVLLQQGVAFEVIIVDDGSTDGSAAVAERLVAENRHWVAIRCLRQQNSGQPAVPRNRGIAEARGQYILCLDADDFLAPDYLFTAYTVLEHSPPHIAIASGDQQDVGGENAFHRMQEFNAEQLKIYNHLLIAALFRKSLWEEIGGFRLNVRGYEDWDFWLAATARGYQAQHIETLFFYRVSDHGVFAAARAEDGQRKAQVVLNNASLFGAAQRQWAKALLGGDPAIVQLSAQIPAGFIPPEHVAMAMLQQAGIAQSVSQESRSTVALTSSERAEEQDEEKIAHSEESVSGEAESASPVFSIVIPTRNRRTLLRFAVESVRQQQFTDWELILVNDGGEDLQQWVDAFGDRRIRLIQLPQRRGPAAARNAGIAAAKGSFLLFLDDDDVFLPNHLEQLYAIVQQAPNTVHYTDCWYATVRVEGERIVTLRRERRASEPFHPLRLQVGNCAPTPCFVVPRSILDAGYRFDETLPVHEDWEFWMRLSEHRAFQHHTVDTVEVRRYEHSGHLTHRYGDLLRTTEIIYRKHQASERQHPEVRSARRQHLAFMRQQAFARMPEDTVSIIILVHNNLEYTRQCLEQIPLTAGNVPYEVIVVDNASDAETAAYLQAEAEAGRIVLLRNEQNMSFARANNQGAAVAKGKFLVFLNNDTKPLEGWLTAIVAEFRRHPEVGIVGAKLLYGNGRIQHAGMVFGARPGRPEEPFHAYLLADPDAPFVNRRRVVQFVTGACLAIRRSLFQQVGGFDEEYVFGWEDADLCMKVQQEGYQVVYQPAAVLYHYESVTKKLRAQQGEESFAEQSPQEQRNRERFFEKWGTVVQRDMERFFAEDGFEIRGNQLVPKRDSATQQRSQSERVITSFHPRFWRRRYREAKAVLIKSTDAFGDTLTITSIVATLKAAYPHLQIFVAGKERTADIFQHNPDVAGVVDIDSPEALYLEVAVDEVVDYTNIIARLPEYYNGIGYRDIFGNLAGIPFRYDRIVYTITAEERQWAEAQLRQRWNTVPSLLLGVHLISDKEGGPNKRSYPHARALLALLHRRFPDARFLYFGTAPLEENPAPVEVFDLAAAGYTLRQQMALSAYCSHFLTIDSAFFHVGHNLWKKPTLLICGLTNPYLVGNPDAGFAFVRNEALECLECYWQRRCQNECMTMLPPEAVVEAFAKMLENGVAPLPPLPERRIRLQPGEAYEEVLAKALYLQKPAHRIILEDPEGLLPPYAQQWNGVTVVKHPAGGELAALQSHLEQLGYQVVKAEERQGHFLLDVLSPQRPDGSASEEVSAAITTPGEAITGAEPEAEQVSGERGAEQREGEKCSGEKESEELPVVHIIWEGSQFVTHSLALINRQHCLNLLKIPGVELTIIPYERDQFDPQNDPQLAPLYHCDVRQKKVAWERLKDVPTVWIRHQWPPKADPPPIGKWVIMQPWEFSHLRKDFATLFAKAEEIWTPSTFSREAMLRSGLAFDRVQVIPNGVDPAIFTPYGDPYPLQTTKRLRFLYVGGTIFRKGIDVLLSAYAKAFTAADDVVLVIKDLGGDSFYRGQTAKALIEQFRQTPNAPEVIYIDQVLSEREMAALYRACTVLVMPYRGEGFSLPTLEAMASGLAVVVTEGGATEDFVDEHVGWTIPATRREIGDHIDGHPLTATAWMLEPDEKALVKLMQQIYDRPGEAFLRGVMGARRARQFWTWQHATMKLLTRIDALVGTTLRRIASRSLRTREDSLVAVGMAEEALERGKIDEAIQLYEVALTMRGLPERYALLVLHRLAWLSLQEGQEELCEAFLHKAAALAETHPDAYYIRAAQFLRKEQWENALELLQLLMDRWKEWKFLSTLGYGLDTLLVDTATALYHLQYAEDAYHLLSLSVQLNPQNRYAWELLAQVAAAVGRETEAAAFRERLESLAQ